MNPCPFLTLLDSAPSSSPLEGLPRPPSPLFSFIPPACLLFFILLAPDIVTLFRRGVNCLSSPSLTSYRWGLHESRTRCCFIPEPPAPKTGHGGSKVCNTLSPTNRCQASHRAFLVVSVACTGGVRYLIAGISGGPAPRPQHTASLGLPALAATGRRRRFCFSLWHLSVPTQPTSLRATLD